MYPVSAVSPTGKHLRYYACCVTKKENNCNTHNINKEFIEDIADKYLLHQFNSPENLECIVNKVYDLYAKKSSVNDTITSLASDLKKVNLSISNILCAIEQRTIPDTTKSRLKELEQQRQILQEKLLIEQSKQIRIHTKEEICNYQNMD